MKIYYTYHVIDPEDNRIFYIGKGHGKRYKVHMGRALRWRATGYINQKVNKHFYYTLLKIYDKGMLPVSIIVFETLSEEEAHKKENEDIKKIGLHNLCNLTHGGEGETKTQETLEKMSKSIQAFWNSEDGYVMRKRFSEEKTGKNNPMWGVKLDEETINKKVDAMLSKPRWNIGLKNDPRSKGHSKGEPANNALRCKLINEDGRVFEAHSLKELSKLSGVPLMSINRLHLGMCKKNRKGWKFELIKK